MNYFSYSNTVNKNISDLSSKFDIENVSIKNLWLSNVYWPPKMHRTPINPRFIIAFPKSSIYPSICPKQLH